MVKRTGRRTIVGIVLIALTLIAGHPVAGLAADKTTPTKKPKASADAKTPKSKTDKPTYQTAEKAAKAKACFGEAPKIEKLSPDEGKAGQKVTIT